MDRADLDDVPERDSKTQGLNLSPRLNFVPPPEIPAPESASTKARAMALGIDALIGLAALILLAILYGGISSSNGLLRIKINGPALLMTTVLWLGYMTWMEWKKGASIGKRARGLLVVMEDGEPLTPEAALTRNLMRFLDAAPYVVPYVVGAYAISNSRKKQRFGDRVAETLVVVSSPGTDPAGLPPPLLPLGSGPAPASSTPRKRRRLAVVVLTLLVIVAAVPPSSS